MLTNRQLIQEFLTRTAGESATLLDHQAGVWPPGACPESSFVPITGLDTTADGKLVIVTGKKPPQPPPPPAP